MELSEPSPFLSKTLLTTHPARKCVFEFLRVITTDSLTSPSAAKGQGVIDAILEVRENFTSSFYAVHGTINNYWMRLSMIGRIIKAKVYVIC